MAKNDSGGQEKTMKRSRSGHQVHIKGKPVLKFETQKKFFQNGSAYFNFSPINSSNIKRVKASSLIEKSRGTHIPQSHCLSKLMLIGPATRFVESWNKRQFRRICFSLRLLRGKENG